MPLDPGGHRLQTSQKRSSYTAAHKIFKAFCTRLAACILGVCMAATQAQGLPHELANGGKTPDALLTVHQISGRVGLLQYVKQ